MGRPSSFLSAKFVVMMLDIRSYKSIFFSSQTDAIFKNRLVKSWIQLCSVKNVLPHSSCKSPIGKFDSKTFIKKTPNTYKNITIGKLRDCVFGSKV